MFNWCKRKPAAQPDMSCILNQISALNKHTWELELAQRKFDEHIREAMHRDDTLKCGDTVSCTDYANQAYLARYAYTPPCKPYDVILLDDLTWGWRVYRRFDGQTVEVYNSHLKRKE